MMLATGEASRRFNDLVRSHETAHFILEQLQDNTPMQKSYRQWQQNIMRRRIAFEKYSNAIKEYRSFVIQWVSSTWITMNLAFTLFPSTLLGTLPLL